MAPRDFFVRLVRMYKCTEFHSSRIIGRAGLIFLLLVLVEILFENGELFGLSRPHLKTSHSD